MARPICWGVPPDTRKPCACSALRSVGSASACLTSCARRAVTSEGVRGGATNPFHAVRVSTDKPPSAKEGTPGTISLRSGKVAYAGLDVYAGEPDLHEGYYTAPNVVLLPHLGSATVETRDAMGFRALDNLDAVFAGREPRDRVG